ncbi:30S ribosomal protein S9, partial [uncultured Flavonifractor sp.]|uniref:30S ribosomal protein S9 n=1 Tax=uncultured Flavonifractor sp. TaxID=1193534 RepID=UPI0026346339
ESKVWKATGRRKRSIAQVSMSYGKGSIVVNGEDVNSYMPYETLVMDLKQPLVLTENDGKFDIVVKVNGGGFNGQTGAIRLGIARCLLQIDPNNRTILKESGMITRDSRIKERKKYGLKKARRAPQFSKR